MLVRLAESSRRSTPWRVLDYHSSLRTGRHNVLLASYRLQYLNDRLTAVPLSHRYVQMLLYGVIEVWVLLQPSDQNIGVR